MFETKVRKLITFLDAIKNILTKVSKFAQKGTSPLGEFFYYLIIFIVFSCFVCYVNSAFFCSTASAFLFAKSLLGAFRRFCFFLYFIVHAPFVSFSPVRTLDDRETRGRKRPLSLYVLPSE